MISGLRAADGRGRHRAPASLGPELPLCGQTKYEPALCQTGNELTAPAPASGILSRVSPLIKSKCTVPLTVWPGCHCIFLPDWTERGPVESFVPAVEWLLSRSLSAIHWTLDNNGPSLSLITGKTLFRMRKTVRKSIKPNSPVLLFWDATKSSEISLKFFLLIFRKLRTICWTWSLTFMTVTLRQSRCLTRCYPPCPCPRYPHWGRHPPPPLPPPPAPP